MRRKYYKHRIPIVKRKGFDKFYWEYNECIELFKLNSKKVEYNWFVIYYFFYNHFILNFKLNFNKINLICSNCNNQKSIILEPVFAFNKQYLAKRTFFKDFLKINNLGGYQNFKKNKKNIFFYGDFFKITKYNSIVNFSEILLPNDENKSLFKLKKFLLFHENFFFKNICSYFFFIVFLNCLLVFRNYIYVSLILKLNKKYI